MKTGLILMAHGARDPRWAEPFEAVAAAVRQQRPGLTVLLAYLDFMAPKLPEAAAMLEAQGCTQVQVLPMFLGSGGHVREDLPRLVQAASEACPGLGLSLLPAVSELPSVRAAMAAAAISLLDGGA